MCLESFPESVEASKKSIVRTALNRLLCKQFTAIQVLHEIAKGFRVFFRKQNSFASLLVKPAIHILRQSIRLVRQKIRVEQKTFRVFLANHDGG